MSACGPEFRDDLSLGFGSSWYQELNFLFLHFSSLWEEQCLQAPGEEILRFLWIKKKKIDWIIGSKEFYGVI